MDGSNSKETRRIALCQIAPAPCNVSENTKKVINWIERAARAGGDVAIFGEMVLQDYDLKNYKDLSEPKDGPSSFAIASAAKKYGVAVIYGYSEVEGDHYYNSVLFINKDGKQIANYRKVHVWPTETAFTPGDELSVVDWDGVLKVGLGVCVDVCMPEFIQAMVVNGGAQLIVIVNALVEGRKYQKTSTTLVPARAFENRCYIAYVDLAGEKYLGASRVCNPHAECIVSACSSDENMLLATIPLNTHKDVPFHYLPLRRPKLYRNLSLDYKAEAPWKREDAEFVQLLFSHRACYYDNQMENVYTGPSCAAHALASIVEDKKAKILDVASGTGLVGKALFDEGFTNLVALDRSKSMLECLAKKNVYSKIIEGSFEEEAKKIASGSFQVCTCVGAFLTAGFLDPSKTVEEMVRIVEVGGCVLLLWNETELMYPQCRPTKINLESNINKLVSSGKCKCVLRECIPNYLKDCQGMLCILKKESDN